MRSSLRVRMRSSFLLTCGSSCGRGWIVAAKAALRGVSSAMRRQVDGSIEVVASPASGFSPDALSSVLLRWPRATDLTLLNVGGSADLAPLATTALARLTSLTVRQVGGHHAHGRRLHGRTSPLSAGCAVHTRLSCCPYGAIQPAIKACGLL
jgi:hypothetical protein